MLPPPPPEMAAWRIREQVIEAEFVKQAQFLQRLMTGEGRLLPFLSRQLYSTTGWLPGFAAKSRREQMAILKKIKAGRPGAGIRMAEARKALREAQLPHAQAKARKGLARAQAGAEWTKLTGGTLPGMAQKMFTNPRAVLSASWRSMPLWQKGLFGYMGYVGGRDVLDTPQWVYGQQGFPYKSRLHHLGSEMGSNLALAAGGPLGLVPDLASYFASSAIGGLPGRLTASPPPPLPPGITPEMLRG